MKEKLIVMVVGEEMLRDFISFKTKKIASKEIITGADVGVIEGLLSVIHSIYELKEKDVIAMGFEDKELAEVLLQTLKEWRGRIAPQ